MTAGQGQYGGRKTREGTVVSDRMQKTVVVAVRADYRHPLYKKTVRRVRRLMAHDEREDARLGDRVRIVESSPISARKRWRLVEVLTRAELPEVAPESIDLDIIGEGKREDAGETPVAAVAEAAAPVAAEAPAVEAEAAPEAVAEAEPADAPTVEAEAVPEAVVVTEPEAPVAETPEEAAPETAPVAESAVEAAEAPAPEPAPAEAEPAAESSGSEAATGPAPEEASATEEPQ